VAHGVRRPVKALLGSELPPPKEFVGFIGFVEFIGFECPGSDLHFAGFSGGVIPYFLSHKTGKLSIFSHPHLASPFIEGEG